MSGERCRADHGAPTSLWVFLRALGETLVKIVETVSKRLGMDAVVLTVLKENVGAYKFYTEKMGYGVDALSPDDGPEGGSSHYLILSKRFE